MARREDLIYDDIPNDTTGRLTSITDNEEELANLLLRLLGGAVIALQLLNEASPTVFRAVKYRLSTFKSIVSQMPDDPIKKDLPAAKKKTPAGFRFPPEKEPDNP